MAKKTYVLDTCVYLTDANCIKGFQNNDIIVPLKVLDEIDKHKKRQDSVGSQARSIIRSLDELRSRGPLHHGVRIAKGKGILKVKSYNPFCLPDDLDLEDSDNQIIATALSEIEENKSRKVVVVSRDINMRVKCDSLGILTEDYQVEQVVASSDELYSGFAEILVDEPVIDDFYDDKDVFLDQSPRLLSPNQFVMLISNSNPKKTALGRFINYTLPISKVYPAKSPTWDIPKARNKEQQFALDLLMNPEISVVTLIGKAGSGKILRCPAEGLEQIMGSNSRYKKVVETKAG